MNNEEYYNNYYKNKYFKLKSLEVSKDAISIFKFGEIENGYCKIFFKYIDGTTTFSGYSLLGVFSHIDNGYWIILEKYSRKMKLKTIIQ